MKRITRIEFITRVFKAVNLFLVRISTLTSYQVGEVTATNEFMLQMRFMLSLTTVGEPFSVDV